MAIRDFFNAVIEYETPRYVKVHNPLVGLVLRSSQALIISYIVGWAIIHERGYQESSPVESSFITKVKGTTSSDTQEEKQLYNRSGLLVRHLTLIMMRSYISISSCQVFIER